MNSLILTAHDFRTPRKASIHAIANELSKRGTTRFFSLRYSRLSKWTADSRYFLNDRADSVELVDGVECYLWKERLHPFNVRRTWLRSIEAFHFQLSRRFIPNILKTWICAADTIIFESGSAIAYVTLAHALNPQAKLIYRGSDDLHTIESAYFITQEFSRVAHLFDAICLLSPKLAAGMPPSAKLYWVPNALDPRIAEQADPTPYGPGVHAVSVGSMLFDAQFFKLAAPMFPQITFHVIGPGLAAPSFPTNVRFYGEMAYSETLRYIKHASFGIAPYRGDRVQTYLGETSLKLMQYRFFCIPAVCPTTVVADSPDRHGYIPGSAESIFAAITEAQKSNSTVAQKVLVWKEAVDRLLNPTLFPDTEIRRR